MSYKDNIQNLINERLAFYSNNPKEIARDYTIENSIKEEYDGRQLLEMLQNVDDTQSKKAMIDWSKSNKTLIIANYGEAFSFEGIESLMRSHSSPKTKENYIGNKGLGFRSLLTWAKQIHIYANDCKISFSEEISAKVFNEKLKLNPQQREDVYTQAKISQGLIPFPVLAIPKLEVYTRDDDWQTVIEIKYKEDVEEKIASVIDQISEELLLFLNHIEEINLIKDGIKSVFKSTKLDKRDWTEIAINDKVWRVFTKQGEIPNKPNDKKEDSIKKYMLKVAFQNDLSDTYDKLFNFFPTKISVSLPCIIHGTFDLNTSRDYLNPIPNNTYICRQLATFLGECALRLTTEDVSWKPYKLINPINSSSDASLVTQLYKDLEEIRATQKIIPTINNDYTNRRSYKHYNDSFNQFFKTNFPKVLPQLILSVEDLENNFLPKNHYNNDILVREIDALSNNGINLQQRAELIYQLINCGRLTYKKERFSLLINDEENKAVIDKNTVAFTPIIQSTNKFVIPDSVKIDFINEELYQLLSNKLKDRFDSKNQISREFQNAVKEVVNVQPYDSNSIIIRIVNGVNKALDTKDDILEKHRLIKDMVSALFQNFKHLNNQLEKLELPISLISKSGDVVSANSLFLGSTYPDGKTIEWLYDGIYSNEQFLKEVNYWNLQDENIDEVERFFMWLGINKYAKIATKKLEGQWDESHYFNFIFQQQSPAKPVNFKLDRLVKDTKVYFIENIEDVLQMDETRQLIILLKDDLLKSQIEQQEVKYIWRYVQSSYTLISSISYLKYQFLKNGKFSSYVLEDGNEQLQSLINQEVKIDLDKLKSYNFHTPEITNILIKLGAKQNIDFLKPPVLYNALLKTATHFTNSKSRGVQGIYKRIVDALEFQDSFKEIKQEEIPKGLKLYAKKEGKTVLLPANQVFYSNNSVLPEKIEKTMPVLDFPKRGGQDKVHRFLGVQIIDVSKIKITEVEEHTKLDSSFQNLFEQLKHPILLYRLYSKSLPKEVTTREAISQNIAYIKNCTIQLVKSCTYNYSNTSEVALDDFEFVIFNNIFYLKAPEYLEMSDLIKASQFSDAFAEIMSIQFNVTELKNDFRFLIRNDLKDTLHLITKDFDIEKLEKVKNYFGIPAVEDNFWKNIYQIKELPYPEHIIKQSELIAQINTDLDIVLSTDYLKFDFDECSNTETYNVLLFLCTHLNFTLKEIYPKGIASYHFEKMRNLRESKESKIKKITWKYLDKNPKEQHKFLEYLDTFKLAVLQSFYDETDKYKPVINYEEYFKSFIENQLPIKVEDNIDEAIQIENQYQYFSDSYIFDIDDLKDEVKSLFYFTGNEVKIKEYLNENYSDVNQETVENSNNNNTVSEALDIIDCNLEKKKKQSSSNSLASKGKRKKRLVVSSNANNLKNLSGKIAEEKVYASYKKEYGGDKVKWVSKYSSTPDNNDNLQYDISYEDENGIWRYVEVKSLSYDDSFVLTQAEKKYGIENNSLYEFALVNNQSIYRIANPYTFDAGDTFEENESFTAEVKDYQIHFKIKTI